MWNLINLRFIGTRFAGKFIAGCKAQETTGPQRQSLKGGEGRVSPRGACGMAQGDGSLRPPKMIILSSAPRYQNQGCHIIGDDFDFNWCLNKKFKIPHLFIYILALLFYFF